MLPHLSSCLHNYSSITESSPRHVHIHVCVCVSDFSNSFRFPDDSCIQDGRESNGPLTLSIIYNSELQLVYDILKAISTSMLRCCIIRKCNNVCNCVCTTFLTEINNIQQFLHFLKVFFYRKVIFHYGVKKGILNECWQTRAPRLIPRHPQT